MHNSLRLSFTNIWGLPTNFFECESFLESNSPDILALCETNLDDSIDSGNFSEFLSFNLKRMFYFYVWSCNLCEGRTSFCTGPIPKKLCGFLLNMFLTGFTSLSVLLFFCLYQSTFLGGEPTSYVTFSVCLSVCLSVHPLRTISQEPYVIWS